MTKAEAERIWIEKYRDAKHYGWAQYYMVHEDDGDSQEVIITYETRTGEAVSIKPVVYWGRL